MSWWSRLFSFGSKSNSKKRSASSGSGAGTSAKGAPAAAKSPSASAAPSKAPKGRAEPPPFEIHEAYDYPPEEREEQAASAELAASIQSELVSFLHENADQLPAFPSVASQVFELIEKPDFDVQRLVTLIQRDSVMSTEVLRIANSPMFRTQREVASVRDAVVHLGAKQVANVAAAVSTRSLFDLEAKAGQQEFGDLWQDLWLHSMTCATTAFWVADELRLSSQQYAYLAGMLHDIGKTISLWGLSKLVFAQRVPFPLPHLTRSIIEANHVEAGRVVTAKWDIPQVLTQTVVTHHELSADQDPLIPAVGLTSALNEIRRNPGYERGQEDEVWKAVDLLKLKPLRVRGIVTRLRESQQIAENLDRK